MRTPGADPWRTVTLTGDRTVPRRQSHLREHNAHLVLRYVLDAAGPVSRAEISAATGLTRATVSALVDRLVRAELLTELEPFPVRRAGRPAVPLVPARGSVTGLGLEVNVDYLGARVIDLTGEVLADRVEEGDFRGQDPAEVLACVAQIGTAVLGELTAERVGRPKGPAVAAACLALPGLVDRATNVLRLAPNLRWRDLDVVGRLGPLPGVPAVTIANEADLAARAELTAVRRAAGPGAPPPSFLYVSGEIGIGAAIVLDGHVFGGQHGWSGELGHTVVDPSGPLCSCGAAGCLETYAGKDALHAAAGLSADLPVSALREAAAHDGRAQAAIEQGAVALGTALANFMNLVDVHEVVLGGIFAPLAPELAPVIRSELRRRVLAARWTQVTVRAAVTGPRAALTGAALTALAGVVDDPVGWAAAEGRVPAT